MAEKKSRTQLDQSKKEFKKEFEQSVQNVSILGGASTRTAADNALDVAIHAGYNKFKRMEARLRENDLRDDALENAKVPKFLRAAVLNLEEDTTLLVMFFAGKQVHMFWTLFVELGFFFRSGFALLYFVFAWRDWFWGLVIWLWHLPWLLLFYHFMSMNVFGSHGGWPSG
jgi:hypothetical protein